MSPNRRSQSNMPPRQALASSQLWANIMFRLSTLPQGCFRISAKLQWDEYTT